MATKNHLQKSLDANKTYIRYIEKKIEELEEIKRRELEKQCNILYEIEKNGFKIVDGMLEEKE